MELKGLLKSQANEVYLTLAESNWNPSEFEWTTMISPHYSNFEISQLNHKTTKSFFRFDISNKRFFIHYSPGEQTIESKIFEEGSWGNMLSQFKAWLKYLGREINSPNLWAELPQDTKLLESVEPDGLNSKFTVEEKKYIKTGLEEIKQYLLTAHKLDPELVEAQIKYLVESSNRLGRKDWKNILISALFGLIITASIPSTAAQQIFQFVWTILRKVLIEPLLLPQ